jgi:hypothetical protein
MDHLSSQPRDILYLIISFLAYTPDTAVLGRTCQTLDHVPQWYEHSGHCQPHNEYVQNSARYVDGKLKERFYRYYTTSMQCIELPSVTHFVMPKGQLVRQDWTSKDHKTCIDMEGEGMVWRFSVFASEYTYELELENTNRIVECSYRINEEIPAIVMRFDLNSGRYVGVIDSASFPSPTLFDFDWGVFR